MVLSAYIVVAGLGNDFVLELDDEAVEFGDTVVIMLNVVNPSVEDVDMAPPDDVVTMVEGANVVAPELVSEMVELDGTVVIVVKVVKGSFDDVDMASADDVVTVVGEATVVASELAEAMVEVGGRMVIVLMVDDVNLADEVFINEDGTSVEDAITGLDDRVVYVVTITEEDNERIDLGENVVDGVATTREDESGKVVMLVTFDMDCDDVVVDVKGESDALAVTVDKPLEERDSELDAFVVEDDSAEDDGLIEIVVSVVMVEDTDIVLEIEAIL